MAPVLNPFTNPRQTAQAAAEKVKPQKSGEGEGGSAIDTSSDVKDKKPAPRPRTLSNEDVDKMAPEQMFRTTLNEHGEMVLEDEPTSTGKKTGRKGGKEEEDDDLDLYDAMTAD